MYQSIAHCAHQRPRYLRMLFFDNLRDSVCGFPDDDQIQLNGSHRFYIGFESIKIHLLRENLDLGYCIENIFNAFFPISRRHARTLLARADESAVLNCQEFPGRLCSRESIPDDPAEQIDRNNQQDDQIRPVGQHHSQIRPHHGRPNQKARATVHRISGPILFCVRTEYGWLVLDSYFYSNMRSWKIELISSKPGIHS